MAGHHQAHSHRGPTQGPDRPRRRLRRLRRLRLLSGAVPGPSHQARLARGSDHDLQHGSAVLALPPKGPSQPVDGRSPPRTVRGPAPGADPMVPSPRPLTSTGSPAPGTDHRGGFRARSRPPGRVPSPEPTTGTRPTTTGTTGCGSNPNLGDGPPAVNRFLTIQVCAIDGAPTLPVEGTTAGGGGVLASGAWTTW